ncbi:MAG TPA: hypothetical protein PLA50_14285, partial [Bacteroidia bacterium]|nr:hypothetical protein [Bacteroidia bacterium]
PTAGVVLHPLPPVQVQPQPPAVVEFPAVDVSSEERRVVATVPMEPADPIVSAAAPLSPAVVSAPGAPSSLTAALAAAAKSQPLDDVILERLLVAGAELRAKGNTQGAMRSFREVESARADHPRVLSEIAATLGLMGLKEKGDAYWQRVEEMGEVLAGEYFAIAGRQLRGEPEPAAPVVEVEIKPAAADKAGFVGPADMGGRTMKIGEVRVAEEKSATEGQKVSLNVVIDADPATSPVGDDLELSVFFYDRLSSGEIRATNADTSYERPTFPYDWKDDGTETIVVNYLQPALTDEQRRETGDRGYYGYVIELYYRGELQEKIAVPQDLAALREAEAPTGSGSPGGLAPENALFPKP